MGVEDVSALIEATQTRLLQQREHELAALRRSLVQTIRFADFESLVQDHDGQDLLAVVGADGFALMTGEQVRSCGRVPSTDQIKRLLGAWRERSPNSSFLSSNALARDLGDFGAGEGIAGAISSRRLRFLK